MFRIRPFYNKLNVNAFPKRYNSQNKLKKTCTISKNVSDFQQSSLVPILLGSTTVGITGFCLSYHFSSTFREELHPYIPDETKKILDKFIGPNCIDELSNVINELLSSSNVKNPFKSSEQMEAQHTSLQNDAKSKIASSNEKTVTTADYHSKGSENVIEEFDVRIARQLRLVDELSKSTLGCFVDYETKIVEHCQKLKRAIEDDGSSEQNPWEEVTASNFSQNAVMIKAQIQMDKLDSSIADLERIVKEGQSSDKWKTHSSIRSAQETIINTKYSLKKVQADIEKAQFTAQITSQYKELIQQSKERFRQEMASLSPSISNWTNKKSNKLSVDDLNALIVHAHKRIHQLQARIAELESMEAVRLEAALKEQAKNNESVTTEQVKLEVDRERSRLIMEKSFEIDSLEKKHEADLRQALTRQASAHSEHVTQLLRSQKQESDRQNDLLIREALVKEHEKTRAVVDSWRMRVEGIEAAVEGRADKERISREAQDLWVACHALQTILSSSASTPPLERYLLSFEEAAQPSSLPVLRTFINSIPKSAVDEGVCTKHQLSKRFDKVKRVCSSVSMVGETGGHLGLYFLSWIRSLLLFTPPITIDAETEIDPQSHTADTHVILASAEKALWRQDLELTIRLMNLLTGMPRAVAQDWITDARVYLETQQAADVLSSYTSSKTAASTSVEETIR